MHSIQQFNSTYQSESPRPIYQGNNAIQTTHIDPIGGRLNSNVIDDNNMTGTIISGGHIQQSSQKTASTSSVRMQHDEGIIYCVRIKLILSFKFNS